MNPLVAIAVGAASVLVVLWIVVSFLRVGRSRTIASWLGAWVMYVGLLAFFLSLLRRALDEHSRGAVTGFGFLAVFFTVGLCVCTYKVVGAIRGRTDSSVSATS
jgi:hypothetical protein